MYICLRIMPPTLFSTQLMFGYPIFHFSYSAFISSMAGSFYVSILGIRSKVISNGSFLPTQSKAALNSLFVTYAVLYFSEHLYLIKIIFINIFFIISLSFLEYMLHETKDLVFLIICYKQKLNICSINKYMSITLSIVLKRLPFLFLIYIH